MKRHTRSTSMIVALCALVFCIGLAALIVHGSPTAASNTQGARSEPAQPLEGSRVYAPLIMSESTPTPTSTATPTVTPTPSATQLSEFIESFPSCGGFPHDSSPDWYWQGCVEGDIYEIQRINTSFTQAWYASGIGSRRTFTLEADARLVQGAADYRLFFNNIWYQGFYAFGVNPVDGTFAVWRVDKETDWAPLVDWTYSPHIHRDNAVNRLKVVRDEAQISVFVNGQYLTTVSDETYITGTSWGVYARNWVPNSILHYFNMAIRYPRPPTPTPTPTRTPQPPLVVEIPCTQLPQFGEFPQGCVENNSAYGIQRIAAGVAEVIPPGSIPEFIPNFSLEGDLHLVEGEGAYGLSLGPNFGTRLLFAVNPVDGTYALWYQFSQVTWVSSPHIKTNGEANHLKILHNPGTVSVYVNHQLLTTTSIDQSPNRMWGLLNTGTTAYGIVYFRNLKFTNLR
ncbi:MAG: hypothetical protein KF893_11940 [Caldilineaceae bacterium]|nr:hypothetical protein [Caldilineaceae bacterium]